MLRDLGAVVIDADEAAHAVYEPGSAGFDAVVGEFGPGRLGIVGPVRPVLDERRQHQSEEAELVADPAPMIEPTSACEELFGSPIAQVPRFQMMAAINSAKIMAYPAPLPT